LLYLLALFLGDLLVIWIAKSDVDLAHDPKIVFMVISKHTNYERRAIIRETWKAKVDKHEASHVFFFLADDDPDSNPAALKAEMKKFDDIVMLNMTENYALLKYKVVNALNWIEDNIKYYDLIVKIDDDVWINVDKFYPAASNLIYEQGEEWFIWGYLHWGVNVQSKGKNADVEFYKLFRTYPPYPNGPLYALHTNTARWIVELHKQGWLKYYFNEDDNIGVWTWGRKIRQINDQLFPTGTCSTTTGQHYGFFSANVAGNFQWFEDNWRRCGNPCMACITL
jgi:hypothetical protein